MILYFTGTGNSRDVACRLSKLLGDDDVTELRGDLLRDRNTTGKGDSGIAGHVPELKAKQPCKAVVWVFPVYSWGVPPVVVKFIKTVQISGITAAGHHLVATCGDDAGLTARQWRRLIKSRGWNSVSASTVIMPNCYTLMKGFDVDPESLAIEKLEASVPRVQHIAERIRNNATDDDVTTGKFAWFKSKIIYPWFIRFAMSPKPFHATDACISCGLCARGCPTCNIVMGDDKLPHWGNNCALCLRCYHSCPTGAVQYGKATQNKGRYLNKQSKCL